MKRVLIVFLALVLVLSFAGCGAKEKAGEALAEKIMEEAGDVDVDIDGDKITIEGEDGEVVTFGETEWPTSNLAKSIPEFKEGKIVSVVEANDSLMIGIEQVRKEDFTKYHEEIKEDYTVDAYDATFEGSVTFSGSNADGIVVNLYYVEETFSIIVGKESE
jgi:hypothetical protein